MWGQIAGAVIGGVLSNKAAKRSASAMDRATEANMAGFNLAKLYLEKGYSGGSGALDYALDKGAYGGSTYAPMTQMSKDAYDYLNQFGLGQKGNIQNLLANTQGFGTNYANLYGQTQQDKIKAASDYALANSPSLINAAMRDSKRQLDENTLRNIDLAATGSGNTNSSRAGVAEALANRAYDDRRADVTSNINDQLTKRYLNQDGVNFNNAMAANNALANTYKNTYGFGRDIANMGALSGGAYQKDAQQRLNEERDAFVRERDFRMKQYGDFMGNIMGRSPMSQSGIQPNLYDPAMAGVMGAVQGAGIGGKWGSPIGQTNWGQSGNAQNWHSTGGVNPNSGYNSMGSWGT